MYKSIITFAIAFYSCLVIAQNMPELSANKQALIKQAKIWVADQVQLEVDQVEISATDRRLKIPSCEIESDMSFSFGLELPTSSLHFESTLVGISLIKS